MLSRIKSILRRNGYKLYQRPYELNIVGVRAKHTKANSFDDEIHVFYKANDRKWNYHIYKATTDPGTFWLKNPYSPQGTAILAQGQYREAYTIGLHQGKYTALVQRLKPVTVIRDYDRNALLDFLNGSKAKGMFGINIHRASAVGSTKQIDRYSAGCQVFKNASDFKEFLTLCERHRQLYGNVFTYTLLDFRAIRRESLRRITIGAATAMLGVIGYINYDHD